MSSLHNSCRRQQGDPVICEKNRRCQSCTTGCERERTKNVFRRVERVCFFCQGKQSRRKEIVHQRAPWSLSANLVGMHGLKRRVLDRRELSFQAKTEIDNSWDDLRSRLERRQHHHQWVLHQRFLDFQPTIHKESTSRNHWLKDQVQLDFTSP